MSDEATLAAGTEVHFDFDLTTVAPAFAKELLGVLSFGAVGVMADSKESTVLKDKSKKYGAGMQDAPDKALKFQIWALDADQVLFVQSAQALKSVKIRVTYPVPVGAITGKTAVMEWKLLGFEADDVTGEDWQMGTINAKQNSIVWTDAMVGELVSNPINNWNTSNPINNWNT